MERVDLGLDRGERFERGVAGFGAPGREEALMRGFEVREQPTNVP